MRTSIPHFVRQLMGDKNVAAISPSSTHLIRRLLRAVPWDSARVVVELGPGPGVATVPVLAAMPRDAVFLAIERNGAFADELRKIGDPRLRVLNEDARSLPGILKRAGLGKADAIIASIPFTYLSPADREALVAAAHDALAPGGTFVIFHQYSPLMRPYMKRRYGAVKTEFEPLNLFPCFLMRATKAR